MPGQALTRKAALGLAGTAFMGLTLPGPSAAYAASCEPQLPELNALNIQGFSVKPLLNKLALETPFAGSILHTQWLNGSLAPRSQNPDWHIGAALAAGWGWLDLAPHGCGEVISRKQRLLFEETATKSCSREASELLLRAAKLMTIALGKDLSDSRLVASLDGDLRKAYGSTSGAASHRIAVALRATMEDRETWKEFGQWAQDTLIAMVGYALELSSC